MSEVLVRWNETDRDFRLEVFSLLYDLAVSMTADHDLDSVLHTVVERVRELLGADTAYIALRDQVTGDVYMHSLSGIVTEAFARMRVPYGTGLGGLVAKSRKGYIVHDYFAEAAIEQRVVDDIVSAENLISGIAAPIQMGKENLGVLYAFNRTRTAFSPSDLDLLFLLANLAAVAISHHSSSTKLKHLLATMEEKVAERTAELKEAVLMLQAEAEEKRRSRAIKEALEEQLAQAQKMEAIGRLAGGIAHDFNNLLTLIIGHAEHADKMLFPLDPARNDLNQIKRAGGRAAELTQQLLAYSRKQFLRPTVVDLNEAVEEVRRMLERLIGAHIEVRVQTAQELPPIRVDRGQLGQVLMNLALNARDAMEAGGALTIGTYLEEQCSNPANGAQGGHVVLAITDTGHGMDATTVEKIFDPFFTTKELGKGTGLGLATVHGIVGQSGGFITVDSKPGAGTTFRVHFPVAKGEGSPEESGMSQRAQAGGERILVVEDDPDVLNLITATLELGGYKTTSAGTGEEALALLKTSGGDIHLMLTDVVMKGMNGFMVAEEARALNPDLRVLFMSGYTEDIAVLRIIRESGFNYLQKPFLRGALEGAIREILDREG